jgi:hypothetical protein
MQNKYVSPKPLREFFFWSGIVATVCYRAIVILNHYSKSVSLAAWYIGTVGFIVYFWHRYLVSEKRVKLIQKYNLVKQISEAPNLSGEQIEANEYILQTLLSTKEKWNYIAIFVTSILAMVIGIYLDFIAK